MNDRKPAEVFPPGEFIRDELEERGWTQSDLAKIMGRPLPVLNLIISGRKSVTPETAVELGSAFGTSAEFWLNLETAFQLSKVSVEDQRRSSKSQSIKPASFAAWQSASRKLKSAS